MLVKIGSWRVMRDCCRESDRGCAHCLGKLPRERILVVNMVPQAKAIEVAFAWHEYKAEPQPMREESV